MVKSREKLHIEDLSILFNRVGSFLLILGCVVTVIPRGKIVRPSSP